MTLNVLAIAFLIATSFPAIKSETNQSSSAVEPLSYNVHLTIPSDIKSSGEFNGTVDILLLFNENLTESFDLKLDQEYLTINSLLFNNLNEDYTVDNATNLLTVRLVTPIYAGRNYSLAVNYVGKFSSPDEFGLSTISYAGQKTNYYISTQFESVYASRIFPCFDKLTTFNSTFNLTVSYPDYYNALFATEENSTVVDDSTGFITATFQTIRTQPAVSLAFILSEFTCTNNTVDSILYRVCSREETETSRNYTLEVAPKLIDILNNYTDVYYDKIGEEWNVVGKLDQVAFSRVGRGSPVNENNFWGLLTSWETSLFWETSDSSIATKPTTTANIAELIAQQVIRFTVTLNGGSEICLDEGLATYLQYYATHLLNSSWEQDKQFIIEQQTTLQTDSLNSSLIMQNFCTTENTTSSTILNSKGASIIRMLSHFVESENFQAGLRSFLKDSSTEEKNIWSIMSSTMSNVILPENLSTIMDNWMNKAGYPLLTASLSDGIVTISQESFHLNGEEQNTKWYVPVTYTTSSNVSNFQSTSPNGWLTPTKDLSITLPSDASWVLLNNQQSGYYRVNYDEELWTMIRTALSSSNFDNIDEMSRSQLVDDLFNLARKGVVTYSHVTKMTNFLSRESSYYTWYSALKGYEYMLKRVGQDSTLGKAISSSIISLMRNLQESVPLTSVNETDVIYTRKQVLVQNWACKLAENTCSSAVKELFDSYISTNTKPHPNIRSVVYCNALRYSNNESDWTFLWNTYLNSTYQPTERRTIMSALGCTKDENFLKEYLNKTLDKSSGFINKDAEKVHEAVYSENPEGVKVALDFLIDNYDSVVERFEGTGVLRTFVKGIVHSFSTSEEMERLEQLFERDDISSEILSASSEALEFARINLLWKQNFEDDLTSVYFYTDTSSAKITISSWPFVLLGVMAILILGLIVIFQVMFRKK